VYGIIAIIGTTGISMAYAINIQLSGDVQVDENLNVDGVITGPTIDNLQTEINNLDNSLASLSTEGIIEKPNTLLIDGSNNPGTEITYSQFGFANIPLDGSNPTLNVQEFRKFCVFVAASGLSAQSVNITHGKLTGNTWGDTTQITIQEINCFEVSAPDMLIRLDGGTPSSTEFVRFWVYLTS